MEGRSLQNRLLVATALWRETSEDPLPKLPPGDPASQIEDLELRVVELLSQAADPTNAREIADRTWDLVHDRPDTDPVKQRVVAVHEDLANLGPPGG